jgi:rhodanese-related sulfurtransferase
MTDTMSKRHKNRQPQMLTPQSPATPAPPHAPPPCPESTPPGRRPRPILLPFAAIIGLSAVLGFTFNAANPIGIRLGNFSDSAASLSATGGLTNFALLSLTSAAPTGGKTVSPPVVSLSPASPPNVLPLTVTTPPPVAVAAKPAVTNLPAAAAVPSATNAPTAAPNPVAIHWAAAKSMMATGQVVLVDVRTKPTYDGGHIPNAISLPEASPPEAFADFVKAYSTNLTLITYCSSTSCSQSLRVAKRFVNEFHYPSVKYMTGGYLEYQREELAKPQPQPPTNQP